MYQFSVLLRVMLDTFSMAKEISVIDQRYQAVLAVIASTRGVAECEASAAVLPMGHCDSAMNSA